VQQRINAAPGPVKFLPALPLYGFNGVRGVPESVRA